MIRMSRTYALKRLLEHGRMTRRDLVECTGWGAAGVRSALAHCVRTGVVRVVVRGRSAEFEAVVQ